MTGPERAPRFARAVLSRTLPADARDEVTADLDELYRRRLSRDGRTRARWWYRAQAVSFALRFPWERLREHTQDGTEMEGRRTMRTPRISALDFKLGVRMLRRYPGLSLIGGFALAGAIGIGVLVFELVVEEIAPRLPLDEGDRVVRLENWDRRTWDLDPHTIFDVQVWRREMRSVEQVGAAHTVERNLVAPGVLPQPLPIAEITPNAFDLARVPPLLGRPLTEADALPDAPDVVVLGYAVWHGRFGADPDILGRTVQIGATPATVVGVMPEGFKFPSVQQAWLPLRVESLEPGEGPWLIAFGRLAPGATFEGAQAELEGVAARVRTAYPEVREHLQPRVVPLASAIPPSGPPTVLWLMFAGVFLVLVAVSANVATLMFARTALRESEIVVRSALGATRGRVIAQLLVESLVLALVSAVGGLVLAGGFLRFVWWQMTEVRQQAQPFWADGTLEPATVLWALGLAVVGSVLVGLLPGLKATRANVQAGLTRARAGGAGLRFGGVWSFIIVAQVALTVVCLPLAIGTTRKTISEHDVPPRFAGSGYLALEMAYGDPGDEVDAARLEATHQALTERLLAEPGVAAVGLGSGVPGVHYPLVTLEAQRGRDEPFEVDGNTEGLVRMAEVAPGFFDVLELPVVMGRGFDGGDASSGAVVVNESLARNLGGNPIGMFVRVPAQEDGEEPGPWHEVVGVVQNVGLDPTERGEADFVYHAASPAGLYPGYIVARTRPDAAGLAARVRSIAVEVDPALRVNEALTVGDVIRRRNLPNFVAALGATIVVGLAVALSAASLFALMAVAVERRTREIGIRVALGARTSGVLRALFTRAVVQLGAGIVLGNLALLAGRRYFASDMEAAAMTGPMLSISVLMALVGVAACAVPAVRALRVQPTEALKGVG